MRILNARFPQTHFKVMNIKFQQERKETELTKRGLFFINSHTNIHLERERERCWLSGSVAEVALMILIACINKIAILRTAQLLITKLGWSHANMEVFFLFERGRKRRGKEERRREGKERGGDKMRRDSRGR